MITPAVLILACGSISLTTSQRLNRSITRTRQISSDIREIYQGTKTVLEGERFMLYRQLINAARRSVLLQRTMTLVYIATSLFIATSLLIGVFEILNWEKVWIVIGLPMLGSVALFAGSIILIIETRLALKDVDSEMNFRRSTSVEFRQKGVNI